MVNEKLVTNEQVQKPVNKTRSIVKTIFVPVVIFIMALGVSAIVNVIREGFPSFTENIVAYIIASAVVTVLGLVLWKLFAFVEKPVKHMFGNK